MKENQYEQHGGNILPYFRQTLRIMRLCLFFLLVSSAMAFSATTYSQSFGEFERCNREGGDQGD